jgi:hypothetical protein
MAGALRARAGADIGRDREGIVPNGGVRLSGKTMQHQGLQGTVPNPFFGTMP